MCTVYTLTPPDSALPAGQAARERKSSVGADYTHGTLKGPPKPGMANEPIGTPGGEPCREII